MNVCVMNSDVPQRIQESGNFRPMGSKHALFLCNPRLILCVKPRRGLIERRCGKVENIRRCDIRQFQHKEIFVIMEKSRNLKTLKFVNVMAL